MNKFLIAFATVLAVANASYASKYVAPPVTGGYVAQANPAYSVEYLSAAKTYGAPAYGPSTYGASGLIAPGLIAPGLIAPGIVAPTLPGYGLKTLPPDVFALDREALKLANAALSLQDPAAIIPSQALRGPIPVYGSQLSYPAIPTVARLPINTPIGATAAFAGSNLAGVKNLAPAYNTVPRAAY